MALVAYKKRATHEARLIDAEKYQNWIREVSGRESATYEIHKRTFRVAQDEGVALWELGVPSLELKAQPVAVTENRPMEPVEVSAAAAVAVLDRTQSSWGVDAAFCRANWVRCERVESDFFWKQIWESIPSSRLRSLV